VLAMMSSRCSSASTESIPNMAAFGGGGVEALLEDFEADAAFSQCRAEGDQVQYGPAEAVQAGDDKGVIVVVAQVPFRRTWSSWGRRHDRGRRLFRRRRRAVTDGAMDRPTAACRDRSVNAPVSANSSASRSRTIGRRYVNGPFGHPRLCERVRGRHPGHGG